MQIRALALSLTFVSTAVVSCAADETPPAGSSTRAPSTSQGMGGMDHGGTFAFGAPADPSDADRIIEVEAIDTPRFDPVTIEVTVGETVTFDVTNVGEIIHEFVLGDVVTQDQHQGEMGDMGGAMTDEPNVRGLEPSEETSLTWTFTEPGTVLYACHVDDHYAKGMVGEIRVGNS